MRRAVSVLIYLSLGSAVARADEVPVYKALKLDSAITVDGRLDEPIWRQAEATAPFVLVRDGQKAEFATRARVLYDDESIYVGVRCQETEMADLKAGYDPPHNHNILRDDAVEIFFDPMATKAHFYQFIINAAGRGVTSYDADYERRLPFEAAVERGADQWTLEVRLPLAELGARPRVGDLWGMNLYRSRPGKRDGIDEQQAWNPTGGGYRVAPKFGYLLFSSYPGNPDVRDRPDRGVTAAVLKQISREFARKTRWHDKDLNFEGRAERAERLSALMPLLSRWQGNFLVYVRPPLVDEHILPWTVPSAEEVEGTISVAACCGEYEPATLAVFACKRLSGVNLEISDFVAHDGKTLPRSIVDPYLIKCWYQDGSPLTTNKNAPTLMAELLLKDPNLISVDLRKRANTHNWTGQFPKDAETLQDVSIEPFESQQYWLTFHIPADARPGDYVARVTVKAKGSQSVSVPIRLKVCDFDLAPSRLLHSLYYTLRLTGCETEADYRRRLARMESEIRNQVEHGINCPSTYVNGGRLPWDDDPMAALREVIEMQRRVGIAEGPFICVTYGIGYQRTEDDLEKERQNLRRFKAFVKGLGRSPVYVHGQDEASGERLRAERPSFAAAHDAGVKVFVACRRTFFPIIGDLLDMPVVAGHLIPELAEKVHANGYKIASYGNPQAGQERPDLYRRNFGLRLWAAGYDGAMEWAYGGDDWNDFIEGGYRQETMAYSAIGKPVDTIQWEGWREGVDDVCYLSTLLNMIDEAENLPALFDEAKRLREWTEELDVDGDLDALRLQIVERIRALSALMRQAQ